MSSHIPGLSSHLPGLSSHIPGLAKLPVAELRIGNYVVCVKNRLAEGGFGFVDLVYEANSKIEYVLKRSGIERAEIYDIVKKEINILQSYAGPHLVKLLASDVIMVSKGKPEACLLLELCPGGHLLDRLNSREGKHLPPASLYRIFGQLLLALKPMHESNPPVTHRDLKLENILFGTVCLSSHLFRFVFASEIPLLSFMAEISRLILCFLQVYQYSIIF